MKTHPYDALAELLEYPSPALCAAAEVCGELLGPRCPEAAKAVRDFAAFVAGEAQADLEELYTRSFDVEPMCCLEIGWHLFGENYHRGELLVRLRVAAREHGLPPSTELEDHLTVVLRLLARLDEAEDPRGLVEEATLPAIAKMLAGFRDKNHPYHGLLDAVTRVLCADFALPMPEEPLPVTRLPIIGAEPRP